MDEGLQYCSCTGEAAMEADDVIGAQCECCSLEEECTPPYAASVRALHSGHFLCGLCSAAVHMEVLFPFSLQQALLAHFQHHRPCNPVFTLTAAIARALRRPASSPASSSSAASPIPPTIAPPLSQA